MYVLYKLLNDSVLVELRNKINFIQEIRLVGVKIQALHKVVVFLKEISLIETKLHIKSNKLFF